jgi:muramoyltetrapeptide carboxypeptidase
MTDQLIVYSPAGVIAAPAALRRAVRRLRGWGFDASLDASALARHQRFAGDDATRLAALHRVADAAPSVALASRGGYGLMRLLDAIDWARLARSVEQGTRWVGYSDVTALQLGLLAHAKAPSWAGPTAVDFGLAEADGGVDEVTRDGFLEAMDGSLEAVGFRTGTGLDGLERRGLLWGGNLTMLCALLGTRHWPRVRGGILFLEEVGEHPYRVERMLLQLHQAGVLEAQQAVLLGHVNDFRPSPLDRGYGLRQALACVRERCATPLLEGLPFGHVRTRVMLPVGRRVTLAVAGRDAFVAWGHGRR